MIKLLNLIRGIKKKNTDEASASATISIFKNMKALAFGAGSAKLIALASIPILTRLYSPEEFGNLSLFTAIIGIIAPLLSFRLVVALPLPRGERIAINILAACIALIFINILIGLTFFIAFEGYIENHFPDWSKFSGYWWLLVVGIVGACLYELLSYWATRKRSFNIVAKTQIQQSFLGSLTKVTGGILGLNLFGLLLGQVIQQSAGTISLFNVFKKEMFTLSKYVSFKRILVVLTKYRGILLYRLPSQFLLVSSAKAPIFYFAWMYGASATGYLGLALIVLGIPMQVFGQTMGKAYFGEIAKISHENNIKIQIVTRKVAKRLFLLAIIPCILISVFSEFMFSTLFGDEWREAGTYASFLAPYLLFQFIASPLVNIFAVLNRDSYFLFINILRFLILSLCFFMSTIMDLQENIAVFLYSVSMSITYLFSIYLILNVKGKSGKNNE